MHQQTAPLLQYSSRADRQPFNPVVVTTAYPSTYRGGSALLSAHMQHDHSRAPYSTSVYSSGNTQHSGMAYYGASSGSTARGDNRQTAAAESIISVSGMGASIVADTARNDGDGARRSGFGDRHSASSSAYESSNLHCRLGGSVTAMATGHHHPQMSSGVGGLGSATVSASYSPASPSRFPNVPSRLPTRVLSRSPHRSVANQGVGGENVTNSPPRSSNNSGMVASPPRLPSGRWGSPMNHHGSQRQGNASSYALPSSSQVRLADSRSFGPIVDSIANFPPPRAAAAADDEDEEASSPYSALIAKRRQQQSAAGRTSASSLPATPRDGQYVEENADLTSNMEPAERKDSVSMPPSVCALKPHRSSGAADGDGEPRTAAPANLIDDVPFAESTSLASTTARHTFHTHPFYAPVVVAGGDATGGDASPPSSPPMPPRRLPSRVLSPRKVSNLSPQSNNNSPQQQQQQAQYPLFLDDETDVAAGTTNASAVAVRAAGGDVRHSPPSQQRSGSPRVPSSRWGSLNGRRGSTPASPRGATTHSADTNTATDASPHRYQQQQQPAATPVADDSKDGTVSSATMIARRTADVSRDEEGEDEHYHRREDANRRPAAVAESGHHNLLHQRSGSYLLREASPAVPQHHDDGGRSMDDALPSSPPPPLPLKATNNDEAATKKDDYDAATAARPRANVGDADVVNESSSHPMMMTVTMSNAAGGDAPHVQRSDEDKTAASAPSLPPAGSATNSNNSAKVAEDVFTFEPSSSPRPTAAQQSVYAYPVEGQIGAEEDVDRAAQSVARLRSEARQLMMAGRGMGGGGRGMGGMVTPTPSYAATPSTGVSLSQPQPASNRALTASSDVASSKEHQYLAEIERLRAELANAKRPPTAPPSSGTAYESIHVSPSRNGSPTTAPYSQQHLKAFPIASPASSPSSGHDETVIRLSRTPTAEMAAVVTRNQQYHHHYDPLPHVPLPLGAKRVESPTHEHEGEGGGSSSLAASQSSSPLQPTAVVAMVGNDVNGRGGSSVEGSSAVAVALGPDSPYTLTRRQNRPPMDPVLLARLQTIQQGNERTGAAVVTTVRGGGAAAGLVDNNVQEEEEAIRVSPDSVFSPGETKGPHGNAEAARFEQFDRPMGQLMAEYQYNLELSAAANAAAAAMRRGVPNGGSAAAEQMQSVDGLQRAVEAHRRQQRRQRQQEEDVRVTSYEERIEAQLSPEQPQRQQQHNVMHMHTDDEAHEYRYMMAPTSEYGSATFIPFAQPTAADTSARASTMIGARDAASSTMIGGAASSSRGNRRASVSDAHQPPPAATCIGGAPAIAAGPVDERLRVASERNYTATQGHSTMVSSTAEAEKEGYDGHRFSGVAVGPVPTRGVVTTAPTYVRNVEALRRQFSAEANSSGVFPLAANDANPQKRRPDDDAQHDHRHQNTRDYHDPTQYPALLRSLALSQTSGLQAVEMSPIRDDDADTVEQQQQPYYHYPSADSDIKQYLRANINNVGPNLARSAEQRAFNRQEHNALAMTTATHGLSFVGGAAEQTNGRGGTNASSVLLHTKGSRYADGERRAAPSMIAADSTFNAYNQHRGPAMVLHRSGTAVVPADTVVATGHGSYAMAGSYEQQQRMMLTEQHAANTTTATPFDDAHALIKQARQYRNENALRAQLSETAYERLNPTATTTATFSQRGGAAMNGATATSGAAEPFHISSRRQFMKPSQPPPSVHHSTAVFGDAAYHPSNNGHNITNISDIQSSLHRAALSSQRAREAAYDGGLNRTASSSAFSPRQFFVGADSSYFDVKREAPRDDDDDDGMGAGLRASPTRSRPLRVFASEAERVDVMEAYHRKALHAELRGAYGDATAPVRADGFV